jgi:hypothetical protein
MIRRWYTAFALIKTTLDADRRPGKAVEARISICLQEILMDKSFAPARCIAEKLKAIKGYSSETFWRRIWASQTQISLEARLRE